MCYLRCLSQQKKCRCFFREGYDLARKLKKARSEKKCAEYIYDLWVRMSEVEDELYRYWSEDMMG